MKNEKSQSGLEDVQELLEELPETFTLSRAVKESDKHKIRASKRLNYYSENNSDLFKVWDKHPPCYSRHDVKLNQSISNFGIDILNKSVQIIWENEEMAITELSQIKQYTDSNSTLTQARMVGEVKDFLDQQYPGIEYNVQEQKFYRDE